MNDSYRGVIIEESLEDKAILKKVKIISTKIENVVNRHKTPWLSKWTLHTVEIPEQQIQEIAYAVSCSLDREHAWYADFKNGKDHYIIFLDRIFKVDRANAKQYEETKRYGISIGIPEYQLDFSSEVK